MRRSPLLTVQILCPHHGRPVAAQRNETSERLVSCAEKDSCVTVSIAASGATLEVRPSTCPVFRN
jgi:hypothetical protein